MPTDDGMSFASTDSRFIVGSIANLFADGVQVATTTVDVAGRATWRLKDRPADGVTLTYDVPTRSDTVTADLFKPAWVVNRQLLRRAAPRLTNPAEPGSVAVTGRPGTGAAAGTTIATTSDTRIYAPYQDVLWTGTSVPDGGHTGGKRIEGGYNIVVYGVNMQPVPTPGAGGKLQIGGTIERGFLGTAWVCGVVWDQLTVEDDCLFFGGNVDLSLVGERKMIAQYVRQLNINGTNRLHGTRADIGSEGIIVSGSAGAQSAIVHAPSHGIASIDPSTGFNFLRIIKSTSPALNNYGNWPITSIIDANHLRISMQNPGDSPSAVPPNGTYTGGYVYGTSPLGGNHGDGFQCFDLNGAPKLTYTVSGSGIVINSPTQATITASNHAIVTDGSWMMRYSHVYIKDSTLAALNKKSWRIISVAANTVVVDITEAGLASGSSTVGTIVALGYGMPCSELVIHNWTCTTGYDAIITGKRRDNDGGAVITRFSNMNVEYIADSLTYFDPGNSVLYLGDNESIEVCPRMSTVDFQPMSCWLEPNRSEPFTNFIFPNGTNTLYGVPTAMMNATVYGLPGAKWQPTSYSGTGSILRGKPPGGDFAPATGPYAPGRNFQWPGCAEEGVSSAVLAPTDITLTNTTMSEAAGIGAVVGWIRAIGPKTNAGIIIDDVVLTGDTDGKFEVVLGELRLRNFLDYETKTSHQITLTATTRLLGQTEPSGLTFSKTFTITVTDAADVPRTPDALGNLARGFDAQSGVVTDGASPARVQTVAGAWNTSTTYTGAGTAKPTLVSGTGPKGQNFISVARSDGAYLAASAGLTLGTFDYSLLCRFRSIPLSSNSSANLFGLFSGNASNHVSVGGDGTNFNRLLARTAAIATVSVDLNSPLDTTAWHHIRITGNGTTGDVILYQDGVQLGKLTVPSTPQTWAAIVNFFRIADIDVVAMALYTDIKTGSFETVLNEYFASRRA